MTGCSEVAGQFFVAMKIQLTWTSKIARLKLKSNADYQIGPSSEGSLKTFQILSVVLGVEQAEHDGEGEVVLHEVEQAVEGQEGRVEDQELGEPALAGKPAPVDFAVRKVVGVEDDQPRKPVRVILDEAGPDHRAPVVADEGQPGRWVALVAGIVRHEVQMPEKLFHGGFVQLQGVGPPVGKLVGPSKADEVRNDDPESGRN